MWRPAFREGQPCGLKHSSPPRIQATSCSSFGNTARSSRLPDSLHPFGHRKVLLLLLVARSRLHFRYWRVLALRQGVVRFLQPAQFTLVGWNYIVLAAAFAFEQQDAGKCFSPFGSQHAAGETLRRYLKLWKYLNA